MRSRSWEPPEDRGSRLAELGHWLGHCQPRGSVKDITLIPEKAA